MWRSFWTCNATIQYNYTIWLIPIMGNEFKMICHLIVTVMQFHNRTSILTMLICEHSPTFLRSLPISLTSLLHSTNPVNVYTMTAYLHSRTLLDFKENSHKIHTFAVFCYSLHHDGSRASSRTYGNVRGSGHLLRGPCGQKIHGFCASA